MLLICLRDDIPLSLNDRQFSQFQGHIRETLYNLTGKYHDVYEHLNNLDVHQIHNIFFCDIKEENSLFYYTRPVMRMYRQEGSVILNYPTLTDWFFHAIKK